MNLVYTAIIGDFDNLRDPLFISEGWKYICYTDQPLKSDIWEIVQVSDDKLSSVKLSKKIKITHPLYEYDNVLWIDGSIEAIGDINEFISLLPEGDIVVAKHPCRKDIYDEMDACNFLKKDNEDIMRRQVERYTDMGEYVHSQNGIMLKRKDIKKATDIWWNEVKEWSIRDQLSFVWSMKQANQSYSTYEWSITRKYFKWHQKHKHDKV